MSELGYVERLMAVGIVVVILGILGIAIHGAMEPAPEGPTDGGGSVAEARSRGPAVTEHLRDSRATQTRQPTRSPGKVDATRSGGPIVIQGDASSSGAASGPDGSLDPADPTPLNHSKPARGGARDREPQPKPVEAPRLPRRTAAQVRELEQAPPQPAPKVAEYEVEPGDNLWRICRKWFGEGDVGAQVRTVKELNPTVDPDLIVPGQVLRMPPKDALPARTVTPPVADRATGVDGLQNSRLYTIRPGDSLEQIALNELGDRRRWKEIYDINRREIPDPAMIQAGQTILLP